MRQLVARSRRRLLFLARPSVPVAVGVKVVVVQSDNLFAVAKFAREMMPTVVHHNAISSRPCFPAILRPLK
jgi:hypothetical protein